jgi:mRNA interferase MazF
MAMVIKRFEIYLVNQDKTAPEEAKNTRPGLVISPDEMNLNIQSVIIAPITSTNVIYPTRISFELLGKERVIVLDQIRTIDKIRLVKRIGKIDEPTQAKVLETLQEMFAE